MVINRLNPSRRTLALYLVPLLLGGCAGALNYIDPVGPRFGAAAPVLSRCEDGELRVVSFNVKYARFVGRAVRALRENEELRNADLILLQEMDEAGTRLIAEALGMNWVYYPASVSPDRKDFGNAILSCRPLQDDRKIVLPHRARLLGNQRIAVAATVAVDGRNIRVYSVHLATLLGNGPTARREQLAAVLDDAEIYPYVIVGGDFNSETVPEIALERGYSWPTRGLPHTSQLWTIDHVLMKGLDGPISAAVVRKNYRASDHRPIWVATQLEEEKGGRGR